jgi:hypothetical protein
MLNGAKPKAPLSCKSSEVDKIEIIEPHDDCHDRERQDTLQANIDIIGLMFNPNKT